VIDRPGLEVTNFTLTLASDPVEELAELLRR
jgi:hypothetical protein